MTVRITNGPFILKAINPRNYTVTFIATYEDEANALNALADEQKSHPKSYYLLEANKSYWSTPK